MNRGRRWARGGALCLVAVLGALVPVGGAAGAGAAATTAAGFSFAGEARALKIAVGGRKAVFGLALSRASLLPQATGAGAGHCKASRIEQIAETGDLPCGEQSTQTSNSEGEDTASHPAGEDGARSSCSDAVMKRLRGIISIRTACGRSTSGVTGDLPFTESATKVPALRAMLGLGDVLPIDHRATKPEVKAVSDYLAGVFGSALGVVAPKRVSKLEAGVGKLVAGYLELGRKLPRAGLIKVRLGGSSSSITPEGGALTVASATAGARIGVLPLPRTGHGAGPRLGDPLRDGLLVIDVGTASASVQVDPNSAESASTASPASVMVRVRDLSKTKPRYIDVAVAEGESVTVLEGTPWQSTITAGSGVSEKNVGSAAATAEPVRLDLLTGMNGGAALDLGGTHAGADLTAEPVDEAGAVPVPRTILPATGGVKPILIPLFLVLAAVAIVAATRARLRGSRSTETLVARLLPRGARDADIPDSSALRRPLRHAMRVVRRAGATSRAVPRIGPVELLKPSATARRKAYRTLAALLALGGIGLFSYPLITDLWAARIQEGMTGDFSRMAANYVTRQIEVGEPLTRIQIPRLGVSSLVVEGITPTALRAGAGHYPMTPLPGEPGNVAIAGHRTSFGSPFGRIDALMPGDEIVLVTPVGRHTYKVLARPSVADPDEWSVITDYPEGGSYLTLTSCHPEGSAEYRIWVRAELVTSDETAGVVR